MRIASILYLLRFYTHSKREMLVTGEQPDHPSLGPDIREQQFGDGGAGWFIAMTSKVMGGHLEVQGQVSRKLKGLFSRTRTYKGYLSHCNPIIKIKLISMLWLRRFLESCLLLAWTL